MGGGGGGGLGVRTPGSCSCHMSLVDLYPILGSGIPGTLACAALLSRHLNKCE